MRVCFKRVFLWLREKFYLEDAIFNLGRRNKCVIDFLSDFFIFIDRSMDREEREHEAIYMYEQ